MKLVYKVNSILAFDWIKYMTSKKQRLVLGQVFCLRGIQELQRPRESRVVDDGRVGDNPPGIAVGVRIRSGRICKNYG